MKKAILMAVVLFVIAVAAVKAESIKIASDESTTFQEGPNGGNYEPSAPAWMPDGYPLAIPGAEWVWKSYKLSQNEAENGAYVEFEKAFFVPECAKDIHGNITIESTSSYIVWVNDNTRFSGEVTGKSQVVPRTYEISNYVETHGMNIIHITAIKEGVKGSAPETNPAGIAFSAELKYDGCMTPPAEISLDKKSNNGFGSWINGLKLKENIESLFSSLSVLV